MTEDKWHLEISKGKLWHSFPFITQVVNKVQSAQSQQTENFHKHQPTKYEI